ncbi:MAG: 4-hydroxybenzoate octaprenyltransferase [Pseudomonadota bacterium]
MHSNSAPRGPAAALQAAVADAVDGNWVDTRAPEAWRPYLRLSRADRPIGTWLLWIPCLWAVGLAVGDKGIGLFDLWLVAGSGIGAFLMRGAGCTWNDLQDREIDAQVARTASRPLPSGAVSARAAAIWMVVQALTAFLILLSFNMTAILWGIAACLPVALYPFAKRFTWWPQLFLGIAINWGALLLWVAQAGSLGWPAVLLYGAGIAWTLHYDTIYAHQDREDDALIGVRSTARLFGEATRLWLWGFTAVAGGLALAAVIAAGDGIAPALGAAALCLHMASQTARLDMGDPARCLALFRETRWGGLAFAAGIWINAVLAVS